MAQFFEVHPENPQPRLLKQAVALLEKGGVLAVPTDSSYALVCQLDDLMVVLLAVLKVVKLVVSKVSLFLLDCLNYNMKVD